MTERQGTKSRPAGLDSRLTPHFLKVLSRGNIALYRLTGGRVGGTWRVGSALRKGVPICLVTTRGRKSGRPRTVPLLFLQDGDRVVIVASQGGLPRHPQWYLNVVEHPDVTVEIGRRRTTMRARVANEAERAELWPRLVELYADFESYQSWTDRVIPVVICEPVA